LKTVAAAIVSTLWLPLDLFKAAWRAVPPLGLILTLLLLPVFGLVAFGLYGAVSEGNLAFALIMLLPVHVALLAPLAGSLLLRAVSRTRIFLADAEACLLTLNPDALAVALTKLWARQTPQMPVSVSLAHLFVVAPFPGEASHAHPSVEQRVAALRQLSPSLSPEMVAAASQTATDFRAIPGTRPSRPVADGAAGRPHPDSVLLNPSGGKTLRRSDQDNAIGGPAPAKPPGVAMVVVGALGLAVALMTFLTHPAFGYLVIPQAGYSLIVLLGGVRMLTRKAYGFARTASIIALFPFGPFSLLTLPIGIWALTTLNQPDVKAAFPGPPRQTGT
jgi:hypothetical protein